MFLERAAFYNKVVVGVAIFHPSRNKLKVLIVQRASHEKVLPGFYELPGGSVFESVL